MQFYVLRDSIQKHLTLVRTLSLAAPQNLEFRVRNENGDIVMKVVTYVCVCVRLLS